MLRALATLVRLVTDMMFLRVMCCSGTDTVVSVEVVRRGSQRSQLREFNDMTVGYLLEIEFQPQ